MDERTMMLLTITERGSGADLISYLNNRHVRYHFQCSGSGTAPSEMMDFLGLGSSDKDIIASFATQSAMQKLAAELSNNLNAVRRGKGIMMILSLSAINHLVAVITARQAESLPEAGGAYSMTNEYQHSLICIAVNQGYTEQVMQTARKAGATGGTIIRARMVGTDKTEQYHGISLQAEKEIITILAPETVRDKILEEVNREFGLLSKAQGTICALPVEKAFKI